MVLERLIHSPPMGDIEQSLVQGALIEQKVYRFGPFNYNRGGIRSLTKNGEEIHLTPIEHRYMHLLAKHLGEIVSKETLAQEHGYKAREVNYTAPDLVKKYIQRLRRKLGDTYRNGKCEYILTFHGIGYMLIDPSSDTSS